MSAEKPRKPGKQEPKDDTPTRAKRDDFEPRVRPLPDTRLSRSVEYGLAVLQCFTAERPVLGIADMADILGSHRSTTHRYMSTLVELGFLQQDSTRKYRLTLHVTGLGMSAMSSTSLEEHSRFYVEELRRRSGYTVSVAVLDGPDILYVERAHSSKRGQSRTDLDLRPGSRLPAYCTAKLPFVTRTARSSRPSAWLLAPP